MHNMGQTYDKPDQEQIRREVLELLDRVLPKDNKNFDEWELYFAGLDENTLEKLEACVNKLPPVKTLSLVCASLEEIVNLEKDNKALTAQNKSHKDRCAELNKEVDSLQEKINELEDAADHPMKFKMG